MGGAEDLGDGGSLFDRTRYGGDAKEVAFGLLEQVGNRECDVDVVAWVGVEEDGDFLQVARSILWIEDQGSRIGWHCSSSEISPHRFVPHRLSRLGGRPLIPRCLKWRFPLRFEQSAEISPLVVSRLKKEFKF